MDRDDLAIIIALLAIVIALLSFCVEARAQTMPPDYVYIYGPKGNRGYQCYVPHLYVESLEPGSILGVDCTQVLSDSLVWPKSPPWSTPMAMTMDGNAVWIDRDDCVHVAHAKAHGLTSTVIDCRPQGAK